MREGPVGDQGDGAYSAGVSHPHPLIINAITDCGQRGGVGNIGSPSVKPKSGKPHDGDVIPELDVKEPYDDYHTGRGGAGNEHHEGREKKEHDINHTGLADKLKNKIMGKKE